MSYIKRVTDELLEGKYGDPRYAIHKGKRVTLEEYTLIVQEEIERIRTKGYKWSVESCLSSDKIVGKDWWLEAEDRCDVVYWVLRVHPDNEV